MMVSARFSEQKYDPQNSLKHDNKNVQYRDHNQGGKTLKI
jgi:hypothetical protein